MGGKLLNNLIDDAVYERFDRRKTVFGMITSDETAPFYDQGMYNMAEETLKKDDRRDAFQLAGEVKKAALAYGAGAVGITKIDRRWIYKTDRDGEPVELEPDYSHAIVP